MCFQRSPGPFKRTLESIDCLWQPKTSAENIKTTLASGYFGGGWKHNMAKEISRKLQNSISFWHKMANEIIGK